MEALETKLSLEELQEKIKNRFGDIIDISLSYEELYKIYENVFYLDKGTLDLIEQEKLYSVNNFIIPKFESLMGLTIYRINKIKDNLRTIDEEDDLKNQAWVGYVYTVKRCISKEAQPPVRSFQNYYGIWLETELLRYIKKSGLLIKTPYQEKEKIQIGDTETNEVALQEAESKSVDNFSEKELYLSEISKIALDCLDRDEKLYIELMFGLNGHNSHSMVDICKIMQISRNKASNMKQTALFKMRNYCIKKGINKDIALN